MEIHPFIFVTSSKNIMGNFFVDKSYYKNNITLAMPVILANVGQAMVGIADNVMVGRLGAVPLASVSFANVIVFNVLVFGMGLAYGLTPLVGAAYSKNDTRKCANLFQNSLVLNTFVGVLLMGILLSIMPLFSYMGQSSQVVDNSINFYIIVTLSILPNMIFLSFKQFMEGLGNTKVAMIITISCNILNVILNYLLIYGKMGFPRMEIEGAAVATFISRLAMPIAFYMYMSRNNIYRRFFFFFSLKRVTMRRCKRILNIGLPISIQMTIEMLALSVTAIMTGWINPSAMAANQIVLSVISVMFMFTSGISGAVTILVSHAKGRNNARDIVNYTKSGIQMSAAFMCFAAILFIFTGRYIAMLFVPDEVVIEYAVQIFSIAVLFEVSDGIQVTALGALRGMTDVYRPMLYAVASYILINIPVAYTLGFVFDMGVRGIWMGFFCGLTVASILFIRRFNYKIKYIRNR